MNRAMAWFDESSAVREASSLRASNATVASQLLCDVSRSRQGDFVRALGQLRHNSHGGLHARIPSTVAERRQSQRNCDGGGSTGQFHALGIFALLLKGSCG